MNRPSRRPRALWISTDHAGRGGIASYVRNARETPLWRDWQIRHVATHRDGTAGARLIAFGVGIAQFVAELILHRPDIVHIHTASYGSFARKSLLVWASSMTGIPVVLHVHGGGFKAFFDTGPRLRRSYIQATLERAAVVVALGPAWAAQLNAIAPRARILQVPNAIQLQPAIRQGDAQQVNVVFLGNVCDAKGAFVLLAAWAALMNDFTLPVAATLTLAGDGELDRARSRAAQLSVEGTCAVRGWMSAPEVGALLAGAHVLVLPSMAEGQPMSILEAMARGLVVIASEVGGIPDLLAGDAGILVAPGDVDGLAAALARVLSDPVLRARLGSCARVKVASDFNIETASARIDDLYRELTTRRRGRR